MVARFLTATLLAFVLLAALGGCSAPAPVIRTLSFTSIAAGTSRELRLTTEGCNRVFDVDRGTVRDDPTAVLELAPGARSITAERVGDELFRALVPADLPVGAYTLVLALSDGRRAPYGGQLVVLSGDEPVIELVASERAIVEPGQTAVPLTVTVSNPSRCTVEGLVVTPRFRRDNSDLAPVFTVSPVALTIPAGQARTATFAVDVGEGATEGDVVLDASANSGQRSGGDDCVGVAGATSAVMTGRWYVASVARRTLRVTMLEANPATPRLGQLINVNVTVRNESGVRLELTDLLLTSVPEGIVRRRPPVLAGRRLDVNGSAEVRLEATPSNLATPGEEYTLRVDATARDDAGNVYTSQPGATTTIVVR